MVKSPGKCVDTSRTSDMVCGESNEINGEKNCLLLIGSEKNCMFKLGVKKNSLITR